MQRSLEASPYFTVDGKGEVYLSGKGRRVIRRGGDDAATDDMMVLMEIVSRAPGMSVADLQKCFIEARVQFAEDVLRAIRTGHIKFARKQ